MDRLIQDFCDDARIRKLSDLTITNYRYSINLYKKFIENKNIDLKSSNKDAIRDYVSHLTTLGRRSKTITNHLAALASFYEYLVYEDMIPTNPVKPVQKRYETVYKNGSDKQTHKLISIEDAAKLVNSVVDIRDRALILLFFKTGIRKGELVDIDISDINWQEQSILLKPKKKRTNRSVFFDDETNKVLQYWVAARKTRNRKGSEALFITPRGRMSRPAVDYIMRQAAIRAGLHDPNSLQMEDHYSPHCCRHWFTTYLLRAGMSREFVQELRGDITRDAIDIYNHIDREELRESYLAHIPQLGI